MLSLLRWMVSRLIATGLWVMKGVVAVAPRLPPDPEEVDCRISPGGQGGPFEDGVEEEGSRGALVMTSRGGQQLHVTLWWPQHLSGSGRISNLPTSCDHAGLALALSSMQGQTGKRHAWLDSQVGQMAPPFL